VIKPDRNGNVLQSSSDIQHKDLNSLNGRSIVHSEQT